MGVVAFTENREMPQIVPNVDTFTWTPLTSANASGAPLFVKPYSDLQLQIKGTWGAGTLTIVGSNDGTNFPTGSVRDVTSLAAVSYAADPTTLIPILENANYIKPVLTGANASDSITVTITCRR